jgi:hypothetical protein
MNIVNKILGKSGYNPMQTGKIGIDKSSHNMVRYNYFGVTLEDGRKEIAYGGSLASVRRQLEDKGIRYLNVKEISSAEARGARKEDELENLRKSTKSVYSNRGIKKVQP